MMVRIQRQPGPVSQNRGIPQASMTGMLLDQHAAGVAVSLCACCVYPHASLEWLEGLPTLAITMLLCMALAALCERTLDADRPPAPASYIDLSLHVLLLSALMPVAVLLFSAHLASSRS